MARKLYTLEVTITEGTMRDDFVARNPVVSRTIEIRSDQTLNQLHRTMFDAFGRWDDCHLSEFQFGERPRDRHAERYVLPFILDDPEDFDEPPAAGSVTTTRIGKLDLQVGRIFWYWYDFGGNWYHEIRVLSIGDVEPGVKYPRVIARVGESPPQYVNWDEAIEDDEETVPDDWVSEVMNDGVAALAVESGIIPVGHSVLMPWIRRWIREETASRVREAHAHPTYQVTTLRGLADGTSELTAYLVPGAYLGIWLEKLREPSDEPETVLSVEA